jgi:hypothetical protein
MKKPKWSNLVRHYSSYVLGAVTVVGSIQAAYPAVYALIPPQVTVALGVLGLIAKVIPQDGAK